MNGGVHRPQRRNRQRLLQRERAGQPDVSRSSERLRLEAMAEAFNALNHRNNLTRNGSFGSGAYPTNPSPAFGQITAVNDPRSVQLALRLRF